ncbi:MAG: MBL fold metallo-hydrolase [Bacteroidota bacterium]|nr:MBL fold metallo-hydrolase [Bacteroidota bacterium]
MFRVTRKILPVGQGAFYFEQLQDGEETKNVIYDCGSTTKNHKAILTQQIRHLLPEQSVIDVLFISHFDKDHVNGIEELCKHFDVKKIIIPEFDRQYLSIYFLFNFLSEKASVSNYSINYGAVDSFSSFLQENAERIVQVSPYNPNSDLDERPQNIHEIKTNVPILSGRQLTLGGGLYIPINFGVTKKQVDDFKNAFNREFHVYILSNDSTERNKIKDIIAQNSAKIKGIYKALVGDVNAHSMIVYSGAVNGYDFYFMHIDMEYCCNVYSPHCYHHCTHDCRHKVSCLYTGDANLDAARLKVVKKILKTKIDTIGVLQLPHHGSKRNLDYKTYKKIMMSKGECQKLITFASFGTSNQYHHPSYSLIEDIMIEDDCFFGVTERLGPLEMEINHLFV